MFIRHYVIIWNLVYMLWKRPKMLPQISTWSAVVNKLIGGAGKWMIKDGRVHGLNWDV
jgi:hypothetical protein